MERGWFDYCVPCVAIIVNVTTLVYHFFFVCPAKPSYNVLHDDDLTAKESNLIDLPPLIQPIYAKCKGTRKKKAAKGCQGCGMCPVCPVPFLVPSDLSRRKDPENHLMRDAFGLP